MLPVTPTDSGWSSAIAPLPDNVVPTAADRASGQRGQLRARARVQHSPAREHEGPLRAPEHGHRGRDIFRVRARAERGEAAEPGGRQGRP